jgi:hypothetical protein
MKVVIIQPWLMITSIFISLPLLSFILLFPHFFSSLLIILTHSTVNKLSIKAVVLDGRSGFHSPRPISSNTDFTSLPSSQIHQLPT